MSNNGNQIKTALSKLGVDSPTSYSDALKNERLITIEKKYDIIIPDDYKQFLRWYGETFFEKNIIFKPLEPSPTATEDGNQYFDGFYGLMSENNINQQIDDYKNRIPGNLIPVGECPGGNLICIGVNGTAYGKIYFWNHENELKARLMIGDVADVENIDLYWDNIYLVSESFVDFLNTLEIDNNDFEEDENMDEIELWLDDDLLDD